MPQIPTLTRQLLPGQFPLRILRIEPQEPTVRHRHAFSELVIITGGAGIHVVGEERHAIAMGDVFVLSGDQAHGYAETESLHLINILFLFSPLGIPLHDVAELPGFNTLFRIEPFRKPGTSFESRLRLNGRELATCLAVVGDMEGALTSGESGWRFAATGQFITLVAMLSRMYSTRSTPTARPHLRLGSAISFLERHYMEPLTLEEIAAAAHMSSRTLLRAFSRTLDLTPMQYLSRVRIHRAEELLCTTSASITEIAALVGIDDSNYFTRLFKKWNGVSPRAWRKRGEGRKAWMWEAYPLA